MIVLRKNYIPTSLTLSLLCFVAVMIMLPGVDLTKELREQELWDEAINTLSCAVREEASLP